MIPGPRGDRRFEESVDSFQLEIRTIRGRPIKFVVEETLPGWIHSCTVDEVARVLDIVPTDDLQSLGCVLFRQPTRKQQTLNPAWGRLTYYARVGSPGKPDVYVGPLITLEACRLETVMRWRKSMSIGAQTELQRLHRDGHQVEERQRDFLIQSTPKAIKQTQLFRTLLHELGHWVDYLQKVERPAKEDVEQWEQLNTLYFARPSSEREAFAHRYAAEQRSRLTPSPDPS